MRKLSLLFALAVLGAPDLAEARHRRAPPPPGPVVVGPRVRVVVSPWMFGYRPAARAGWIWVEGAYAPDGTWIPGYWAPASARPGYVWVPGYWDGDQYLEGYWREEVRGGYRWVDGYYDRGRWVAGYWAPVAPPPPPEPAPDVHHDYE